MFKIYFKIIFLENVLRLLSSGIYLFDSFKKNSTCLIVL